jgi:hypothetical protein
MDRQTAVEWYFQESTKILLELGQTDMSFEEFREKQIAIFKQAKAMEREQIYETFVDGSERGTKDIPFNCEQYFTQTYGGTNG